MSKLVKCPTCDRQVSENAAACPSCGEPVNRMTANTGRINLRDPVHLVGVILAAIVSLLLLGLLMWPITEAVESSRLAQLRERNQKKALIERQQRMDKLRADK